MKNEVPIDDVKTHPDIDVERGDAASVRSWCVTCSLKGEGGEEGWQTLQKKEGTNVQSEKNKKNKKKYARDANAPVH